MQFITKSKFCTSSFPELPPAFHRLSRSVFQPPSSQSPSLSATQLISLSVYQPPSVPAYQPLSVSTPFEIMKMQGLKKR